MDQTVEKYRDNVAAIIINGRGDVLACERNDGSGLIQTVQGGLEGQDPRQAVLREIWEEIGVQLGPEAIKAELPERIAYRWPEGTVADMTGQGYVGQIQQFFLVEIPADAVFSLDHHHKEFVRVFWTKPQDMFALVSDLKKPGFEAAFRGFGLI